MEAFDGDEINLRIDARDLAKAKLDAVQAELRDLDGETASIDIDAPNLDGLLDKLGAACPASWGRWPDRWAGPVGWPRCRGGGAGLFAAANSAAQMAIEAKTTADLTGATVEDAARSERSGAPPGPTSTT